MRHILTDYTALELSPKEKILFYTAAAAVSIFIGWLFYDSPLAGTALMLLTAVIKPRYARSLSHRRKSKLVLPVQRHDVFSVGADVVGEELGSGPD